MKTLLRHHPNILLDCLYLSIFILLLFTCLVQSTTIPIPPQSFATASIDASSSTPYQMFQLTLPSTAVGGVILLNTGFTYTQVGSTGLNLTVFSPSNQLISFASVNESTSTASLSFKPLQSGVYSVNASITEGTADLQVGAILICSSSNYVQPNSYSCIQCPSHSVAPSFAISSSECVCDIDYYSATGRPSCLGCPEGGLCSSLGTIQPIPQPGYYYISSNYPGIGECRVSTACLGGLTGNTCSTGYIGRLCGECYSGYYKIGIRCEKCYNDRAALAIGIIIFLVGVPLLMYLFSFSYLQLNTFPAIIDYLQIIALIGTFSVAWPARLLSVFNTISFVLFNWQLAEPECGVDDYSWYWRFGFTLAMPLILAIDFAVVGFFGWIIRKLVKKCCKKKGAAAEETPIKDEADGSQITSAAVALFSLKTMTFNRFVNFSLSAFFTFLEIVYLPLTYMAFSLYSCTNTAGISYLDASPSIECWSGTHNNAQPVALLALIVYTFGIPFSQIVFEFVKYKQDCLTEDFHTVIRTGALYRRYSPKRWWWPAVAYLRRLLVTLPAIFFIDYPTYQTIATLVILNGYLLAELIAKPYARKLGNLTDVVLIISQYLLLFFGLAYSTNEKDSLAEYIICMVIIFGALTVGFLFMTIEIGWLYKVKFLGLVNTEPHLYFISLPAKRDMAFLSRLDSNLSKAKVSISYTSAERGHLSVTEGSQVVVVNKNEGDMWMVELDGRRGLVPSANLQEMS